MIIDRVDLIKNKMYKVSAKMDKIRFEFEEYMMYDDDDYYDMMAAEREIYEELASQLLDLFE